jgi:hypothetical protein
VIAVAATDSADRVASYSNQASYVDVAAPGSNIWSTVPVANGSYASYNGTSMATPHVAGTAALIKAKYATLDWRGLRARLLANADAPPALAGLSKYGRLNAFRALVVDKVTPGAPTLMKATRRTMDALLVEWKASGDDNTVGTAFQYEIRYSRTPITAANFDTLPLATGVVPRPAAPGTVQQALVTGLDPDTAYYVGIRAWDDAGNRSGTPAVTALNRTLAPAAQLLYDDATYENWSSSGTSSWAVSSENYVSAPSAWTDSPGVSYTNNEDKYLTYGSGFDLTNYRGAVLSFRAQTRLENFFDNLFVQASGDGGATWTTLGASLTGHRDWQTYRYSLAAFGGKSDVRIRFQLLTDYSVVDDGVWIDDIQIYHGDRINVLQDDAENTATSPWQFWGPYPWGVSGEAAHTQPNSYTDSPGASTGDLRDDSLTQSAATPLTNLVPDLSFFTQYDLENPFDRVAVETSTDGGVTWKSRATFTGYSGGFWNFQTPLTDSIGANLLVRFHLTTDGSVNYDGIYLDDITIGGQELVPVAVPGAPGNVRAAALNSTQVKLTWADSLSETGYTVFRKTGPNGTYIAVAQLGANVKAYTNNVPVSDQTFYYTVTAFNAGGSSADSAEVSSTMMLAPTGLAAASGGAGVVNLTWADKTANETNYLVEYKPASATTYTVLPPLPAGSTAKAVPGLTRGTSYNFRVRAQNASGYSSYTTVVTFAVP